jgi:hypothetical protein
MTTKTIEGIVERCAPAYGDKYILGMYFLLVGSPTIYTAPQSFKAYAEVYGRPSGWNSSLVNLTSPGDHVSFEVAQELPRFGEPRTIIADSTFRNWTLEQRLLGAEKDVSQNPVEPQALNASAKLLGTDESAK